MHEPNKLQPVFCGVAIKVLENISHLDLKRLLKILVVKLEEQA